MMTKRNILPLLLALATIFVGCENEIPFNLKDNPPKLVMNALINADSTNNKLFLHLTDPNSLKQAKEAVVEVCVNGTLTEVPTFKVGDITDIYNYTADHYLITTQFHPGDLVRIDARTLDGVHHAWVEVTIPQPIAIGPVDTLTTRIRYNGSFQDMLRYRFTFQDQPQEKNFYRLVIERRMTQCFRMFESGEDTIIHLKSTQLMSGDDIVLSDGQPDMGDSDSMFEKANNIYGIFDDSRLSTNAYTMTAYTYRENHSYSAQGTVRWVKTDLYVRLLSIIETEYYYLKALNVIDSDAYDETMMEPIKFASNVHGGLGIVGISTETSTLIRLPQQVYEN